MIERIKENKILKILMMIIKAIISFLIIVVISIIFIQRISNNKVNLGGYSIYTIITESMVPKYNVYDMVVAKKVDTEEIETGNIVVYEGRKGDFAGKIVTHEVIKIDKVNDKTLFHTKGLANDIEDPLVEPEQIMGKIVMKSNILSIISKVVNNPYGFYFVVFVPFSILVVMEVIDIIEERKSNKK